MRTITINSKDYTINDTAEDLSIYQLSKLIKIFAEKYTDTIDQYIDIIESVTNLSKDEIEDLDLDIFKEIVANISKITSTDNPEFKDTFVLNNVTYKTKAVDGDYKFKLREIIKLEEVIKEEPLYYVGKLAAIIYLETDADGNIVGDLSDASIKKREELFNKTMTLDYLQFYIIKLQTYLQTKNGLTI